MSHYISYRRRNYNVESNFCVSGCDPGYSYFWHETNKVWLPCRSLYCNIHGLKNRRNTSNKAQEKFPLVGCMYGLSLHFGRLQDLKLQQAIYNKWVSLLRGFYPELVIIKVNHWRKAVRHFHVIMGYEYLITRKVCRDLLHAARSHVCRWMEPEDLPKLRMGFRSNSSARGLLNYALRTNKKYHRLPSDEFPPGNIRWEMLRLR